MAYIAKICKSDRRLIIAVAGPPAAGKSTLAERLVDDLNSTERGRAALVPMDGFHLDNAQLDKMGLRHRKGAPETFDAVGFVKLVSQISEKQSEIYYPTFDRTVDAVIPEAQALSLETQIVVIEGNYLLINEQPWSNVIPFLDLTIFVRPNLETLKERLIERWREHGFGENAALDKAMGNDIPNALYVLEKSKAADLEFKTNA
nr:uridine kinase [Ahrensia kielensis]